MESNSLCWMECVLKEGWSRQGTQQEKTFHAIDALYIQLSAAVYTPATHTTCTKCVENIFICDWCDWFINYLWCGDSTVSVSMKHTQQPPVGQRSHLCRQISQCRPCGLKQSLDILQNLRVLTDGRSSHTINLIDFDRLFSFHNLPREWRISAWYLLNLNKLWRGKVSDISPSDLNWNQKEIQFCARRREVNIRDLHEWRRLLRLRNTRGLCLSHYAQTENTLRLDGAS